MKGVVKHKGQVSCRMLSFLSFFSELSYAELHATFPYYFFSFRFLVYFRLFFLEKDRDRTIVYLYDPFHGQSMRIDTRIQTRAYPFSNISLRWFSIINSPIIVSLYLLLLLLFFLIRSESFTRQSVCIYTLWTFRPVSLFVFWLNTTIGAAPDPNIFLQLL